VPTLIDKVSRITDLLSRAGHAHGEYETKVLNGVYDQDWPIWYARWAVEHGLNAFLAQPIDAERLSKLLYTLNEEHKLTNKRQSWAEFTAERLAAALA